MRMWNWRKSGVVLASVGLLYSTIAPSLSQAERSSVERAALHSQPAQAETKRSAIRSRALTLPLHFEVNQGQAAKHVDFLSRGKGYTLALKGTEALLTLKQPVSSPPPLQHPQRASSASGLSMTPGTERSSNRTVVRMQLVGTSTAAKASGEKPLAGKVNYFLGNDPAKWRTDIRTYAKAHYQDVYPGIDLVYYGNQGQLEYDFIVQPGADPSVIQLTFQGATPHLNKTGDVLLHTSGGGLRLRKPHIYQEINGTRQTIEGGYVLSPLPQGEGQGEGSGQISFHLAAYDTTKPLVIDPILTYASYLGGSERDGGQDVATDDSDNVYITGFTGSNDILPAGTDPSFRDYTDNDDAFVAKFSSEGQLVYFTYLGGSLNDFGYAIAVDGFGRAYVTGQTNSNNFPTQGGNADNECGVDNSCGPFPNDHDAFVTWLSPAGDALTFSTFLGGGDNDQGNGIAVDTSGNVYVTGDTDSSNFPASNCFQEAFSDIGDGDAFVRKYDITTSTTYSCFLGGTAIDVGEDIAADTNGNAYITGRTDSSNFPTNNAFQDSLGGNRDAFVTKIDPMGESLVYSTYLGGSFFDTGEGIAVDSGGYAYVIGRASDNFPTTPGVFRTSSADVFVTKLTPSGSSLSYSTYFGGEGGETGEDIVIDSAGNAYITGRATSEDFPQKHPLFGSSCDTGSAYAAKFNPSASRLIYSTCIGGDENFDSDFGRGIALDSNGAAWVTGYIEVDDLPTTSNAFQPDFNDSGLREAFLVQIVETIRAAFESPIVGAVAGVALVRGWGFDIFDGESISEVAFFLNGILNTTIPCCSERKDIQSAFPQFPELNTLSSGWGLTLNWGDATAGVNEVYVRLTSTSGDVWESETREVTVIKPADSAFLDMLTPSAGPGDASLDGDELVLTDVVVRDKFSQVESTVDVRYRFDEAAQGLGLVASTTVAQAPLLKRWYAALEQRLNHWWSHTSLVPFAQANPDLQTQFEAPLVGPVQGVSLVRGWTFDTLAGETIDLVELFIDGVRNTNIPCCSPRQDVANANPGFPAANTLNSGWGLTINWGDLSAGDHTVQIQVTSSTGEEALLDPRTVTVVKLGDFPFIDDFDISAASVSIDGQDIVLTGVIVQDKATQALANITLRLRWSEASQALTIISTTPVS